MAAMSSLGDAFRYLRQRQFIRQASSAAKRVFEGPLRLDAGEVVSRLEITDWDFVDFPRLELLERPAFLPARLSHIDATGGLCYLAAGSLVLDRFDPAGSIAQCLQAAETLLNDLIASPVRSAEDMQDEFLAYWNGGGTQRDWAVIGNVASGAHAAGIHTIQMDAKRSSKALLMISSSPEEVTHVAEALGGDVHGAREHRCWIVTTDLYPVASPAGLPKTVRELFGYLKNWDPALSRRVQQVLAIQKEYLRFSHITFAIHSPAGWLGFSFSIAAFKRLGFRQLPKVCLQYLHGRGGSIEITRLAITQIGSQFIHSRNLTHASLMDRRITLVGCGAVGSYVAQALAKLGAGAGRGQLRLIDVGILEPGNLGRHWLGMDSLFIPKANGVANALRQQFPLSNFIDCAQDVRSVGSLFDADLVIDATGVESVSEMINANHVKQGNHRPPVLYTWVLGNGECVQGLWVDSDKYGCYRCLRQPAGSNYREERFPVLKQPPTTRDVGCHAVTPYSVGAPIEASALATDFVVDWLQGSASPRLRHRFRENADVRVHKSQDMTKVARCPACSHT
jgi:molybdopterin/thiamine biosynthesis adenylyltransferase